MQDLDRLAPRELLNFIRRSIRGLSPQPVVTNDTKTRSLKAPAEAGSAVDRLLETQKLALSRGAMSSSERKIVQNEVTLRIRCIRLIRDSESLTVQETADRLKLAPELIKSQFLKLRQLELIELAGCRETRAGIQAVYKLNELNPSLDFVLAQGPAEIKLPHEIAERERVKRP